MIKDVFNAISNSVESGSPKGATGKGTENVTPGFFGKMLMSLQNQGGEAVSPKNQEHTGEKPNPEQFSGSDSEGKKQALHFGVMPEQASSKPLIPADGGSNSNLTIGVVKVEDEGNDQTNTLKTSEETKVQLSAEDSEVASSIQTENPERKNEGQPDLKTSDKEFIPAESPQTEAALESENLKPQESQTLKAEDTLTEQGKSLPNTEELNSESKISQAAQNVSDVQVKEAAVKVETNTLQTDQQINSVTENKQAQQTQQTDTNEGIIKDLSASKSDGNFNTTVSDENPEAEPVVTEQGKSLPNTEGVNSEGKISQAAQNVNNDVQDKEAAVTAKTNTSQIDQQRNSVVQRSQAQQVQQTDNEVSLGDDTKDSLKGQVKMQAQQSQEEREKRYDFARSSAEGNSISGDRLQPVAGSGASGQQQQNMSFSGQPNWLKFQTTAQQNSSISEDHQAFLNEQVANATGDAEVDEAEQLGINMNRLSDVPIANAMLKRSILPGLTSSVQRAAAEGKENPQMWQKHSFEMEDGNRIELSTRNVDGVIQVKIASSSPELSKLMQQYGQEISDHLENECEIQVALQFNEGNEMSDFFGGTDSQEQGRGGNQFGSGSDQNTQQKSKEHLQHAVRKFGYNQMEWTA